MPDTVTESASTQDTTIGPSKPALLSILRSDLDLLLKAANAQQVAVHAVHRRAEMATRLAAHLRDIHVLLSNLSILAYLQPTKNHLLAIISTPENWEDQLFRTWKTSKRIMRWMDMPFDPNYDRTVVQLWSALGRLRNRELAPKEFYKKVFEETTPRQREMVELLRSIPIKGRAKRQSDTMILGHYFYEAGCTHKRTYRDLLTYVENKLTRLGSKPALAAREVLTSSIKPETAATEANDLIQAWVYEYTRLRPDLVRAKRRGKRRRKRGMPPVSGPD